MIGRRQCLVRTASRKSLYHWRRTAETTINVPTDAMNTEWDADRNAVSFHEHVHAAFLVTWMAVTTSALRIAIWSANEITLVYIYGRATVTHDHLHIIRMTPNLVVSNGDVLKGIGAYNFLVGVAIWVPLTVALMMLIHHTLLPQRCREALQVSTPKEERTTTKGYATTIALIWMLALFFLVPGLLPTRSSLAIGFGSAAAALIWARRVSYDGGG